MEALEDMGLGKMAESIGRTGLQSESPRCFPTGFRRRSATRTAMKGHRDLRPNFSPWAQL
jgi:hypothetical protein